MENKKDLRKKAQKGFTLVEVIVVAVIVAALAAVAIPLYLNYVTTSRTNTAANIAGSAASFIGACINGSGVASGTTPATGGGSLACAGGAGAGTTMAIPTDFILTPGTYAAGSSASAVHKATGSVASPTYSY